MHDEQFRTEKSSQNRKSRFIEPSMIFKDKYESLTYLYFKDNN